MEKRVRFRSAWLPWVLIAPQMAIILVFFFWPAAQALHQSVLTRWDADAGYRPSAMAALPENGVRGLQIAS